MLPVITIAIVVLFISLIFSLKKIDESNQPAAQPSGIPSELETPKLNDMIQVTFPAPNDVVGGTIYVTGIARGPWYFEGDFPTRLIDEQGKELAAVPTDALLDDWMIQGFVPFEAVIRYPVSKPMNARLVLEKDNPSDMRELDASITIPIRLEPKKTTIKAYFLSSKLEPHISPCDKMFPVSRPVDETLAVGRTALEELLKGVTEKEKTLGYYSAIGPGVRINNLDITGKTARVDLSKELTQNLAGTCQIIGIQEQIKATLKQFSSVEEVIISVDGDKDALKTPDLNPYK